MLRRRGVERGLKPGGAVATAESFFLDADEEERQAAAYAEHRRSLYRELNLRAGKVWDIGCGTGAVTAELTSAGRSRVVGIDRRGEAVRAAAARHKEADFIVADAARLPCGGGQLDAVTTAFTLTWVADPAAVVAEVRRVLRPGGVFAALAEPDYEGLIEYPEAGTTRDLVVAAVRARGGDPTSGRKLPARLSGAAFEILRIGVINSVWTPRRWAREEQREIALIRRFVARDVDPARWESIKRARAAAIEDGSRLFFLPVFFAVGRKIR